MRPAIRMNTFRRINIVAPKRTASEQIQWLNETYDLNDPIVGAAIRASVNQRVKVSNEIERPYWEEVFNGINSIA